MIYSVILIARVDHGCNPDYERSMYVIYTEERIVVVSAPGTPRKQVHFHCCWCWRDVPFEEVEVAAVIKKMLMTYMLLAIQHIQQ